MSFATEQAHKEKAEVRARLLAAIKPDEPNPYPRPAADRAARDALWMADYADALERLLRAFCDVAGRSDFYGGLATDESGPISAEDFCELSRLVHKAQQTLGDVQGGAK